MKPVIEKMQSPDTYFNRGAELVKKVVEGSATREDIKRFTSQIVFDLQLGNVENVLQKYVVLKNLGTLLKSIEKELQEVALNEAQMLPKEELANVLNARISIKRTAPEYEFDDPRWIKMQAQLRAKEVLIEETKMDVANMREELSILAKILLDEGCEGKLLDEGKETLSVTMK